MSAKTDALHRGFFVCHYFHSDDSAITNVIRSRETGFPQFVSTPVTPCQERLIFLKPAIIDYKAPMESGAKPCPPLLRA